MISKEMVKNPIRLIVVYATIIFVFVMATMVIYNMTLLEIRAQNSTPLTTIDQGWKTLTSEPTPIEVTNRTTGIMIAAFSDKHTGGTPLAFAHANSFPTAKSPDSRTGNTWSIGDEVYVIPVSTLNDNNLKGSIRSSTTFFIIDWRRGTSNVTSR